MINKDKWINSLHKKNIELSSSDNQLDHSRWTDTIPIPKKNTYNSVKKYSLVGVLFICGLLIVSVVKNETRILQKEISNLKASINSIKLDLHQNTLEYEVITSPENIERLAKENLEIDFITYKKSQIKQLNGNDNTLSELKVDENKKDKKFSKKIKLRIAKKIKATKTEIRKLQELYSSPEKIPGEVRQQVAKKIEIKSIELKNLYSNPYSLITSKKAQQWAGIQVVKVFLGIPIVPGR